MNMLGAFLILAASCGAAIGQDTVTSVVNVGDHVVTITVDINKQRAAIEAIINGTNQFAPTFFREVSVENPGNLIVSSPAAFIALSMLAYGSSGNTKKAFKRLLHLPDESLGKAGYANFIDSLNDAQNVELCLANKIFITDTYTIERSYRDLVQTIFRSDYQYLNFGNAYDSVNTINEWVKEVTKNHISDLFSPYSFSEDTAMVLINALSFKAFWDIPFENLETGHKPFHVTASRSVELPFVYKRGIYRYGVIPELNAKLVEIPYEAEEFSMIIILPSVIGGLAEVEEKLARQDLTELIKTLRLTDVNVFLPKFKIESTLDLAPALKRMGISRAFNRYIAEFCEIFNTRVYINDFVQKAFIEVNDKGTDVTVVHSLINPLTRRGPRTENFYVDHPFHLSIIKKDRSTNKKFELFTVRVFDPLQ